APVLVQQRRAGLPRRQHVHHRRQLLEDRKSTRLNSSHRCISYAVFCLTQRSLGTGHANNTPCPEPPGDTLLFFQNARSRGIFFLNNREPPEISPFPQTPLSG